jgi:hypothetical protein
MSWSELQKTNPGEARAARKMIRAAFAKGHRLFISTANGGPVHVDRDSTPSEVEAFCDCLGACDEQTITVQHPTAKLGTLNLYRGALLLIWGNAPDGSELIADYTDTPACGEIWEAVHGGNA